MCSRPIKTLLRDILLNFSHILPCYLEVVILMSLAGKSLSGLYLGNRKVLEVDTW